MNYLLLYLEENYGLTSEKKVQSAIKIACRICLYRPATFLPCHHQAG